MNRLLHLRPVTAIVLYVILDTLCVAAGRGVPVLCILFGFVMGWYLAIRLVPDPTRLNDGLPRILGWAALSALVTFLEMVVIWGPAAARLFGRRFTFAHLGHPFLPYRPRASLVSWILLMVLVSPVLQLLATVFAGDLTNVVRLRKRR